MPGMKQLIFFTESFPYGKGESFIENEIEYLSREFDRIYILPKTSSTRSNVLYLQIVSFSLRYSEVRGNLYSKDYFVSVHSFIFSKN